MCRTHVELLCSALELAAFSLQICVLRVVGRGVVLREGRTPRQVSVHHRYCPTAAIFRRKVINVKRLYWAPQTPFDVFTI